MRYIQKARIPQESTYEFPFKHTALAGLSLAPNIWLHQAIFCRCQLECAFEAQWVF